MLGSGTDASVYHHTPHARASSSSAPLIRQAATSTAISASVFQPERPKPTSTASSTSTSRDGFGTNFCYRNQMRDSAQGHVLQLVEAFISRLATYKPTQPPTHAHAIALHSCLIVALHVCLPHCLDITRCLTRRLPCCHCIARRLSCCICLRCHFSPPHLSYIMTLHSHITELHAPWRSPHFPSAPAFARLRMPVHGATFDC